MSFPRYPECKDSGVEWLGQVPVHWYIKTLKYVATYNDEVLPESTSKDYPIKYVEISDVDEQLGITKWTEYPFASAPSRARRILKDGDVLISTVRTYLRAIAPVTEPPDGFVGSTGFAVIRPVPGIYYSALLGYVIRAEWFISNIISRSVGVSYPAINASDLVALSLPVPPWKEQKTIAHFLDHETAKIDTLIHEQKRLIELLKEKRQAVISHAVTKGLDPDVPMKDSGVEWLGEVPEHWQISKLGHYAVILTGFPFPSASFSHDESDVRLLRGANIGVGSLKWVDTVYWQLDEGGELPDYLMKEGQIVLGMDRPWISEGMRIARVTQADMPCLLLQRVAAITPNSRLDDEYLYYFLTSEIFKIYVEPDLTGVSVPHISPEQILGFKIPIPDLDEQGKIGRFIKVQLDQMAALFKQTNESVEILQERRSALISAAVTGKIDVRDWQPPADESAFQEVARDGQEAIV